jgi:quercetin dioxygenase-like cupin family protein
MTPVKPRDAKPDAFLDELADEGVGADELAGLGLLRLSESLGEIAPPPSLRARILADAEPSARLGRFASTVAELLDLGIDKAKQLLERIDDPSAWVEELPGISFFWVEGGPRVAGAVRGFVRVDAGHDFPEHEHLGDEVILVLQGGFEDAARGLSFHAGDIDRMPQGTAHAFRALPGVKLLKLSVVQTGLRALGHTYLPR